MSKVFHRALYNYDADAVSNETGLECKDPSRTRQSDAAEADINTIVRNFGLTGQLPQGVRIPEYGDFDVVSDYRSAVEAIRNADASFMAMPADVRFKFSNDPQQFLEFCANPENLEEMRKLGLAVPAAVPPPESPSGSEAS